MSGAEHDLAVVGAGIVGVSCALWARRRGLGVLLLDGDLPGSGASYGNAGTIATYACVPVNSPSIIRELPALLFSRESPLGFDAGYVLRNLPWMARFLRHCTTTKVRDITDRLGDLLAHADAGLNPLIEWADAADLMVGNGCLYVYSTQRSFEVARESIEGRRRNGVRFDVLDGAGVRALEPALRAPFHSGLLFDDARHVVNPQALTERLFRRYIDDGGAWQRSAVRRVDPAPHGTTVTLADGRRCNAARTVIAAGAHSGSIEGCGIDAFPLDTERGHHIQFKHHGQLVSRPVGWADAGLYATPMEAGLRIAGTVEIAGLHRPISPSRIAYLKRRAQEMFGDLGQPDEEWIGFRPTLPDALPVIGTSPRSDRILFAFGHQHLGLTLGGITGRIVADLVQDRSANLDISAFDPRRFAGSR
jgi:D-amino-acid dehydrogenase